MLLENVYICIYLRINYSNDPAQAQHHRDSCHRPTIHSSPHSFALDPNDAYPNMEPIASGTD